MEAHGGGERVGGVAVGHCSLFFLPRIAPPLEAHRCALDGILFISTGSMAAPADFSSPVPCMMVSLRDGRRLTALLRQRPFPPRPAAEGAAADGKGADGPYSDGLASVLRVLVRFAEPPQSTLRPREWSQSGDEFSN